MNRDIKPRMIWGWKRYSGQVTKCLLFQFRVGSREHFPSPVTARSCIPGILHWWRMKKLTFRGNIEQINREFKKKNQTKHNGSWVGECLCSRWHIISVFDNYCSFNVFQTLSQLLKPKLTISTVNNRNGEYSVKVKQDGRGRRQNSCPSVYIIGFYRKVGTLELAKLALNKEKWFVFKSGLLLKSLVKKTYR